MLIIRQRFYTVIALILCAFSVSRAQRLALENYSINNGVPQSQILEVIQDHTGVMWFGTSGGGVCKFDGIKFTDITTRHGLKNNRIYTIFEDSRNTMWIGTMKGLNRIDNGRVSSVNDTLVDQRTIHGMMERRNGELWMATSKGIAIYNGKEFKRFAFNDSLAGFQVYDVEEDYVRNVWIATNGNGVFCYNGKTLEHITTRNGLCDDRVSDIMVNNGKVWIGTVTGLSIYDPLKSSLGKQAFKNIFCGIAPVHGINSMYKSPKGDIWLGSTVGLIRINNKGDTSFITVREGLPFNRVMSVIEDREGNMWCGTYGGGVCKYKGDMFTAFSEKEGLCHNTVMSIYKDSRGRFWFGTWGGGACMLDMEEWKRNRDAGFRKFGVAEGLRSGSVWNIAEDKNGHIWFGTTAAGAFVYNGKGMTLYNMSNKLGGNKIAGLMRDNDGNMWIAHETGVDIYDGEKFSSLDGVPGFSERPISAICQDLNNNIWMASNGSILKYDGSIVTEYTPRQTITRIRSIAEDKYGNIWLSIDGGICRFDGKEFKVIDENSGLSSSTAYFAYPDDKGNLWIGTNRGVDKLNLYLYQKNGETLIKNYGIDEGFIGVEVNQGAYFKDNDGKLWFGTVDGVTIYNPEADRYNAIEPRTTVNGLRLFYENFDFAPYSDTVQNGLPQSLKLPYDKNYLTFDFTGICHTLPQKVRYRFMMEGFDKKWSSEVNVTSATYSNLPPGKYTFMLIACNNDGVWNKKPVTFSFEIVPPFWRTTWFYVLCTFLGIAGVFTITVIRERNFRHARKVLETKVEFRTKELREEQQKLQRAYIQIDDKNKDIMDSIHYAKRIQESILPPYDEIRKLFADSFVFFKPKDIVSGDFYWVEKWGHQTVISAVDCTGHGVPGAFMSIVGSNILTEAVNVFGLTRPSLILNELSKQLSRTLHHKGNEAYLKDGMDLAVCMFDKENSRLEYAGAFNPLWMFRDGVFQEIKADRCSIGATHDASVANNFTNHQVDLKKGDTLYIFSDGYADQFGGPYGKKFKYKQMQQLLTSIQDRPMDEQGRIIEQAIEEWRGENEQVDDMLVIGIRV